MHRPMILPATRVVALDFVSLLLLAGAAGIAAGLTLGAVALLFASQASQPEVAQAIPGAVVERYSPSSTPGARHSLPAPRGTEVLPPVPVDVEAEVVRRTL
ncbi:MAG TPA: hypothetical protein VIS77_03795 [Burkholderiales bacterium]